MSSRRENLPEITNDVSREKKTKAQPKNSKNVTNSKQKTRRRLMMIEDACSAIWTQEQSSQTCLFMRFVYNNCD